jgi:hypothetical protein
MKKILLSAFLNLLLSNIICSQKDSVQSLFNTNVHIRIPLKYSYLQWDLGYTDFLFNGTSISGYSLDIIGLVFNDDLDIAAGFEDGSNGGFGYSTVTSVNSYSAFYLKFEPMLFPEKLINLSVPLKFAYSNLGFTNTGAYGGYGRRGRGRGGPGSSFFSFTPGADVFINVLHFLSLGGGVNYRIAFSTPGSYPQSDYDNLSFSLTLRLKLYPKKKNAERPDYYAPPRQRFNQ